MIRFDSVSLSKELVKRFKMCEESKITTFKRGRGLSTTSIHKGTEV